MYNDDFCIEGRLLDAYLHGHHLVAIKTGHDYRLKEYQWWKPADWYRRVMHREQCRVKINDALNHVADYFPQIRPELRVQLARSISDTAIDRRMEMASNGVFTLSYHNLKTRVAERISSTELLSTIRALGSSPIPSLLMPKVEQLVLSEADDVNGLLIRYGSTGQRVVAEILTKAIRQDAMRQARVWVNVSRETEIGREQWQFLLQRATVVLQGGVDQNVSRDLLDKALTIAERMMDNREEEETNERLDQQMRAFLVAASNAARFIMYIPAARQADGLLQRLSGAESPGQQFVEGVFTLLPSVVGLDAQTIASRLFENVSSVDPYNPASILTTPQWWPSLVGMAIHACQSPQIQLAQRITLLSDVCALSRSLPKPERRTALEAAIQVLRQELSVVLWDLSTNERRQYYTALVVLTVRLLQESVLFIEDNIFKNVYDLSKELHRCSPQDQRQDVFNMTTERLYHVAENVRQGQESRTVVLMAIDVSQLADRILHREFVHVDEQEWLVCCVRHLLAMERPAVGVEIDQLREAWERMLASRVAMSLFGDDEDLICEQIRQKIAGRAHT